MNITCENIRSQFTSRGLNLNNNKGKIEEYTLDGKTTRCNTCPPFTHGKSVTLSKNGAPTVIMKTCETNYGLIVWIIVGVCIVLLIVAAVAAHSKHRQALMRNTRSSISNGIPIINKHSDGDIAVETQNE